MWASTCLTRAAFLLAGDGFTSEGPDHKQRVEKLLFSTSSFDPRRRESLVYELKLRIPKLNKITTHLIIEHLDDEGKQTVYFLRAQFIFYLYSRSSRKRPPRELEKVVVTRAGRLRECDLVCDQNQ